MSKRFFLIFYICFLTVSSNLSAITIVRGGGGLGELNALNLFIKIETILNRCNIPQNPCQFPADRLSLLPSVLLDLKMAPQLHFDPNINKLFQWDSSFTNLTINQQYLFDSETQVSRPLKQILSVEVAALLARTTKENMTSSLDFMNLWDPPFSESSKLLQLQGTDLKFYFLALSFDNGLSDVSLVIEGEKSSVLLNGKISSFLGSNDWRVKDFSWQSSYLSLSLEWNTMKPTVKSKKSGILIIKPKLLQGELDLEQSSFQLLNVRG